MVIALFFCAVIVLSIELSHIGNVMGFFQKEFTNKIVTKLITTPLVVFVFLIAGIFLGISSVKLLAGNSLWYASTILFILGVKMFYDGIKLHKAKQSINPVHAKGLIILSVLTGLNSFFVGLSFGLLQVEFKFIYAGYITLFVGILWGYIVGKKLKKLNPHRFEFFLGIIYIIIAVVLVVKY